MIYIPQLNSFTSLRKGIEKMLHSHIYTTSAMDRMINHYFTPQESPILEWEKHRYEPYIRFVELCVERDKYIVGLGKPKGSKKELIFFGRRYEILLHTQTEYTSCPVLHGCHYTKLKTTEVDHNRQELVDRFMFQLKVMNQKSCKEPKINLADDYCLFDYTVNHTFDLIEKGWFTPGQMFAYFFRPVIKYVSEHNKLLAALNSKSPWGLSIDSKANVYLQLPYDCLVLIFNPEQDGYTEFESSIGAQNIEGLYRYYNVSRDMGIEILRNMLLTYRSSDSIKTMYLARVQD